MKFATTIFQMGNNTGIEVPAEVIEAMGGGKKPAVKVTIGSYNYRSTVAVMGGRNLISLSAERRAESGIKGGDAVEVDLELDTTPREVVVPDDLDAALEAEPAARAFFETLSYTNKNKHVLSVLEAKTAETRAKRMEKAMEMLRAGKK